MLFVRGRVHMRITLLPEVSVVRPEINATYLALYVEIVFKYFTTQSV